MDLYSGTEINGYYLFATPDWVAFLGAVAVLVGVAYASWLLSAPQPTPDPTEWSKNR